MVVVNRSLSNLNQIEQIRYWQQAIALNGWSQIFLTGKDCKLWLQRQLTQNIDNLPESGLAVARLDRAAHVTYYAILLPTQSGYSLVLPTAQIAFFKDDLDKFVIMEEITLEAGENHNLAFAGDPKLGQVINFFGEYGSLVSGDDQTIKADAWFTLCGIPIFGRDITGQELVNETRLNDLAVDYDKGCFLGQETAAKINSRRGANRAPMVITGKGEAPSTGLLYDGEDEAGRVVASEQLDANQWMANVLLKRQWRVVGAHYDFTTQEGIIVSCHVQSFPYLNNGSAKSKAQSLYLTGVKLFERNEEERALEHFKQALSFDPTLADVYEAIGVLYGRRGNHSATIEWMDKLLAVQPKSVMAHTNKSLAYMRLGDIEKAEAEKSEATIKSFAMFGDEAKQKKLVEEQKQKEQADLERREGMFTQVLKIDPKDQVALFGLSDIAFKRQDFTGALNLVSQALESNPKHSQAQLLKGKCLEELGRKDEAVETYRHGIKMASAQGELMPANEMQARLSKLI